MRPLTIIALMLALCGLLPAATWYVATTGVDANSGTAGDPWLTISRGGYGCPDGDTLRVAAGTYQEANQLYVAGKSITLEPNGIVIVDANNATGLKSGTWRFVAGGSVVVGNASTDYFQLGTLGNSGSGGGKGGGPAIRIEGRASDSNYVRLNFVRIYQTDAAYSAAGSYDAQSGISVLSGGSMDVNGCTLQNIGGDGIDLGLYHDNNYADPNKTFGIVRNSTVTTCGQAVGAQDQWGDGISGHGCYTTVITIRNTISNCIGGLVPLQATHWSYNDYIFNCGGSSDSNIGVGNARRGNVVPLEGATGGCIGLRSESPVTINGSPGYHLYVQGNESTYYAADANRFPQTWVLQDCSFDGNAIAAVQCAVGTLKYPYAIILNRCRINVPCGGGLFVNIAGYTVRADSCTIDCNSASARTIDNYIASGTNGLALNGCLLIQRAVNNTIRAYGTPPASITNNFIYGYTPLSGAGYVGHGFNNVLSARWTPVAESSALAGASDANFWKNGTVVPGTWPLDPNGPTLETTFYFPYRFGRMDIGAYMTPDGAMGADGNARPLGSPDLYCRPKLRLADSIGPVYPQFPHPGNLIVPTVQFAHETRAIAWRPE